MSFSGNPALLAEISSQENSLNEDRQEPLDLLSQVIHKLHSIGNVPKDDTSRSPLKHVAGDPDMEMSEVPNNQEIPSFSNPELDPGFSWSEYNTHQPGSSTREGEANISETQKPVSYTSIVSSSPSLADNNSDPGDTRKFYFTGDDEDLDQEEEMSPNEQLADLSFDDPHGNLNISLLSPATGIVESAVQSTETDYLSDNDDPYDGSLVGDTHFSDTQMHGSTFEQNFTVEQFIRHWIAQTTRTPLKKSLDASAIRPSSEASEVDVWKRPLQVVRPKNHHHEFYDIQQIPWREKLRVGRSDARTLRDSWYTSYHNLTYELPGLEKILPQEELYFREKSMYSQCKATVEHFQLRNLMSVTSHNTVRFSHDSKISSWAPVYNDLTHLIDLSRPSAESGFQGPVKISTMRSKFGVSIAGGFCGEYAVHVDGTEGSGTQGFVTKDHNGITNHIEIIQHRTNQSPLAVFASNDKHLRILDCETNTFICQHALTRAINCTDTSNDGRLRVAIGDFPVAWVIEADTGRLVQPLRGHRDFGFACAWSPDMLQIATSNQDKTVNIWDVRMWRLLQSIDSDVAGYRSLRFSPVGGGPRTLLMCEPADRIAIVNAQTYRTRQVHDFFGEIAGADYTPDGSSIWVANADDTFGGFMEFERRHWGQQFGLKSKMKRSSLGGRQYQPELPNEWLREGKLDEDKRCVLSIQERRMRFMRNMDEDEHDSLLL
jgi:WD40 repeat protein